MTKLNIQLAQVSCPSCVKKIENRLSKEEGLDNVSVLFNSSKVKAEYDPEKINPDKVVEIIEQLGYEVLTVK